MSTTMPAEAPTPSPASSCRDQIRELVVNGWPLVALSSRVGYSVPVLATIASGRRRASAVVADDVDSLWQELRETPGPSPVAATDARRLGWHRRTSHEPPAPLTENDYLDAQIYRCDTCGNWRMPDAVMRAPHSCNAGQVAA